MLVFRKAGFTSETCRALKWSLWKLVWGEHDPACAGLQGTVQPGSEEGMRVSTVPQRRWPEAQSILGQWSAWFHPWPGLLSSTTVSLDFTCVEMPVGVKFLGNCGLSCEVSPRRAWLPVQVAHHWAKNTCVLLSVSSRPFSASSLSAEELGARNSCW